MGQAAIVCFWCDTIGSLCLINIVSFSKYLNSSINEHHVRQLKGLKQTTCEAQSTEENVKLQPGKPSWDVQGNLTTEKIKGTISHQRSIKGRFIWLQWCTVCPCSPEMSATRQTHAGIWRWRQERCALQKEDKRYRRDVHWKRYNTTKRCTLKYSI